MLEPKMIKWTLLTISCSFWLIINNYEAQMQHNSRQMHSLDGSLYTMDDKQEKEALQHIKSTESWLEFFTTFHH